MSLATAVKLGAVVLGMLVVLATAQPTLTWHKQFKVDFNESTKIIFRRQTTGTWWYDAVAGAEVVHREDGNGDRYCGSIHPLTHTPCRHVVTQGKHYLVFPELQECCLCCTAEQGCGILSPSWLDDAEFVGEEELRGMQVYKWRKDGLQPNYYYATADNKQLPVELDQMPNDLQSFNPSSFVAQPIDPSLLRIPRDCHSRCPISSVCTLLAADETLSAQQAAAVVKGSSAAARIKAGAAGKVSSAARVEAGEAQGVAVGRKQKAGHEQLVAIV